MFAADPTIYQKYVMMVRSVNPMLHVQLHKSVYGLLGSLLLFYQKLRGELIKYGLKMNP